MVTTLRRLLALVGLWLAVILIASPAAARCLARTVPEAGGASSRITIVVPASGAHVPQGQGYQDVSCDGVDRAAYLAMVCDPAIIGDTGRRRSFELLAGISLAHLCLAARLEAGMPETLPPQFLRRTPRLDQGKVRPDAAAPVLTRSQIEQKATR